jgi:hypothetical protein
MSVRALISRLVLLGALAVGGALAPSPGFAADVDAVDGRWQSNAKPGLTVQLSGGRYEVFENGNPQEQGSYSLEGDAITLRKDGDDESHHGRFVRAGDLLLIEPDEDEPLLLHAEGAAAADRNPADVEGRWRSKEGDTLELAGGRAVYQESGGGEREEGTYRTEGDTLIIEQSDDGETERLRWTRVSDRLVIEPEGEDKAVVLAPVPGRDAAEQADTSAAVIGRWVVMKGRLLEFADGTFSAYEEGQRAFSGSFTVDGDVLILAMDGRKVRARFARADDALLIEPEDGSSKGLMFLETPSSPAPVLDPSAIEGRWRNDKGAGLQFGEGRYERYRDGTVMEQGAYRVEGSVLIVRAQPGDVEEQLRWARFGERLAIRPGDKDEALVFVPAREAAASSGPEGRWVMRTGHTVEIGGGKLAMKLGRDATVNGTYRIEGDTMIVDTGDGEERARFSRAGDALLVEGEKGVPVLMVLDVPSGTATPPDPSLLVGRWRGADGAGFEFSADGYAFSTDKGVPYEFGKYRVEGDILITTDAGRGQEMKRRWAQFGQRIALQVLEETKADVLSPVLAEEPEAVDAAPAEETVVPPPTDADGQRQHSDPQGNRQRP